MTARPDYQKLLNQDVTAAILEAEHTPTIEAWRKVMELEQLLSLYADSPLEREVAAAGVVSAAQRIAELENKCPRK